MLPCNRRARGGTCHVPGPFTHAPSDLLHAAGSNWRGAAAGRPGAPAGAVTLPPLNLGSTPGGGCGTGIAP